MSIPTFPQPNPAPIRSAPSRARSWVVIGLVLIGGLVYLAYSRKNAGLAAAANAPAGAPVLETAKFIGVTAPHWTLNDVNGNPVSLSQFKGHPVVMDFWATWCGPCNIELPWWKSLQDKYRAQGVVLIGVSEDDGAGDVKKWLASNNVNYQIVMDNQGLQSTYGDPLGLPTTLYIDRDGKIKDRVSGLESKSELEQHIRDIL